MKKSVFRVLEEMGVKGEEINRVRNREYRFVCFDYSYYVTDGLIPTHEIREQWNRFFGPEIRKGIGTEPSPEELKEFLRSVNMLDDERSQRIEEYQHYKTYRVHKDERRWLAAWDKSK